VNVLSVFDGMACGMLAMQRAGIEVKRYVAYEIDKYAVQTSTHNFPMIEHRGDVFKADFTEFEGFDFLVGGSPCTYWSIAQKNNRETEASGMGWELFQQYVRALHEAKPRFFVYENNKSMSKAIRASIDEAFGFEAICINSALVSAQNRQRLYWVGKRNEDGTYSKVPIEQPEDLGILLKDVLECGSGKPLSEREMDYMVRDSKGKYSDRWAYLQKPGESDKALCITANISKGVPYNICAEPVCASLIEQPHGRKKTEGGKYDRRFEARTDGKSNALVATHAQQFGMVAEPVCVTDDGKSQTLKAQYGKNSVANFCCYSSTYGASGVAEPVPHLANPCEWDENSKPTKAVSAADGKTYTVYEVKDGHITIKGKTYPIKLADGFYIIRKLTVRECMRLQTVPEWYSWPVSDTQAYKMLGNGWTVDVIAHLLNGCIKTN
jgi:DNA (cytosine-5)-methyltransferase 3A